MSQDDNIATQERLGEAAVKGNVEEFDGIFASDVVDHDPAPDQGPGPEGFKQFFTALRTAFPDLNIEVEKLVADDDHVAIAYTVSGTHDGDFVGVAPTGKKVAARGMQIARFEDGKIVERWGSSDELGILQQLDASPAPA